LPARPTAGIASTQADTVATTSFLTCISFPQKQDRA